jgi:hypothetical protein
MSMFANPGSKFMIPQLSRLNCCLYVSYYSVIESFFFRFAAVM